MKLDFVKRIQTSKNSIFYSFIKSKSGKSDKILGFGRKHYDANVRLIKKIIIDNNFNIIEDNNITIRGEDPRCFYYNDKLYILDNYLNDMYLIEYKEGKEEGKEEGVISLAYSLFYLKLNISGKNISFIDHNGELYFIHYIKPFHLYKIDINWNKIEKIIVDDDNQTYNYEYRGGTSGYKLSTNSYYGFGHRTYICNNIFKHDVFLWVVYFEEGKLPIISIKNIEQPLNSKNICDPTSVIDIDDKKYLITAESDNTWFSEQDYITNVYEIKGLNEFLGCSRV